MSRIRRNMENSRKPRFHELKVEHDSKMRLLITHSTSERQGYGADKGHKEKRKKGMPNRKVQEQIVNESHRHITRMAGGGEAMSTKKRNVSTKVRWSCAPVGVVNFTQIAISMRRSSRPTVEERAYPFANLIRLHIAFWEYTPVSKYFMAIRSALGIFFMGILVSAYVPG